MTNYCTHILKEHNKLHDKQVNACMYRVLVDTICTYSFNLYCINSFLCRWQLNNIGLLLHNQTWCTRHVIVVHVHMKLSVLVFTLHSGLVAMPFYAIPICPSTIYLSPVIFGLLLTEVDTHIIIMHYIALIVCLF